MIATDPHQLPFKAKSPAIKSKILLSCLWVALGFVLVDCLLANIFGGMIHSRDRILVWLLWDLVERGIIIVGVLSLLSYGIWLWVRNHWTEGFALFAAATIPILGRVVGGKVSEPIMIFAEQKDLERLEAPKLRSEAAALIATNKVNPEAPFDWREIPSANLPPAIRQAAKAAIQVLVNEECVFIFTETRAPLSLRKCGYLITPPRSKYRPHGINDYVREITDGGGMGRALMEHLMDAVRVECFLNETTVTMHRRLASARPTRTTW